MQEFTREEYNFDPVPFTLVSNQDHFTPVSGALVGQYYLSNEGAPFDNGKGYIFEIGSGFYGLVLSVKEQDNIPRLISIPGMGGLQGYDPVYMRIQGVPVIDVVPVSQRGFYPMTFLMVSEIDHITPLPGINPGPHVSVSRDGLPFVDVTDPVYEVGRGCYSSLVGTVSEDPVGDHNNECVYLIKATAPGADITYDKFQVYRYDYPA